jgi:arabinogalactan oligomer / maltooligosaccharide transport system substrate-binding protein
MGGSHLKTTEKKRITVLLTGVLAAGVLSGCGAASGKDNKLTVWTNMEVEAETLQQYADSWGEENGYEVTVIHQSPSVQQFAQAVKSADGPDAVVGIPNDQLADYVNAGLTAETPETLYDDADFSEAAIQACYVDGKRYAAPLSVETTALFYNTDMVTEVPDSWEELVEQAAEKGGVQFDATSIYYDLGFVRACGGYIFKYENGAYDTSDIGLANDGAVQAYEFINSLCNDYGVITADVTADIARSNFQNGETAYYIGGPWDIDGFTSAGTSFQVTAMPTFHGENFVTPVGTQVSFVSNQSDKQEKAWEFIKYVIDNGALDLYEAGDRIPAKLADQSLDAIQENEYSKAFIEQINHGEPMPTVSEMGQLWSIHTNNIRSMWAQELTPQEAAENMVAQLKEAVELMNSGK